MDNIIHFLNDFGIQFLFTALTGYLLGSICFAIIFTRMIDHKDIRDEGSKNAGFTNTLRCANRKAAILTLVCDFSKGILAVLFGKLIFEAMSPFSTSPFVMMQIGAYIAGFACLIGHIYPVYFGFRGGKGVLTSSAIMLLIDWRVFLVSLSVFILILVVSKTISKASICAAASLPIASFFITLFLDYLPNKYIPYTDFTPTYVVLTTAMALLIGLLIIFMHRSNIKRILNGTEKKITLKKFSK